MVGSGQDRKKERQGELKKKTMVPDTGLSADLGTFCCKSAMHECICMKAGLAGVASGLGFKLTFLVIGE